ncbi:MAG: NADH:ubiquinone reductase (Na(+)-transporting) subunit B [Myxococcota bacterium]|nr:NADH:ubiquinone reductase (Na(+)-transporting) subunit B [Myxococcales bacterium]MEC7751355.1 NADH:ubiquinone reductase (Na(+)-transporting) subunit B [Myxococcota bacterium]
MLNKLLHLMEQAEEKFKPGKPLEKLYPLFEMHETILFTSRTRTPSHAGPHSRDALDSKRLMFTVVIALQPCLLFGIFNTGAQALAAEGFAYTPIDAIVRGLFHVLPIIATTFIVGGIWEVLFAIVRKHEVNEGFLVTGMLFPLTLPATIPLWQVALGITFGVVIGKEVFGGTGMNILNPALTARAFVFFTYPASISGDLVWNAGLRIPEFAKVVIPHGEKWVDGYSGATPLAAAFNAPNGPGTAVEALNNFSSAGVSYDWSSMFLGTIPGSIGETSVLACLLGLVVLLVAGIASWRIMVGCVIGVVITAGFLNVLAGPDNNPMLHLPASYHLVMGSFAFGTIFMATDPVSAAITAKGKWIYGICIGGLAVLIRCVNPAYPEGMMLAILFMNVFAPFLDHLVVQENVKRRQERLAAA